MENKYSIEYMNYIKSITDKFIGMCNGKFNDEQLYDIRHELLSKEKVLEIQSKDAIDWLNKNMITFEQFIKLYYE